MADDVDAEVEIDCHGSYHGELLVVLLAEHGDVRTAGGEEFRHHRGDPVEVTWPGVALHRIGDPGNVDRGREVRRIHRCRGRRVDDVDAEPCTFGDVVVDRTRIVLEIDVFAELEGVDEDRHDDPIGPVACGVDQCEVTAVQGAHRWHERNGAAVTALGLRPALQVGGAVDHGQHGANATGGSVQRSAGRANADGHRSR